ncbi:phytosulfokines 3 [Quercus suber]|uniref:Phytosulfokine n=1 Tax=Quercus suber TaxID=58331 RepID=A0AAW0LPG0_QUESU|nr:phytosulfokines 3-like [Quercus suber]POF04919.1 phytosulfokines 3 [Quercus suber]
MAKIFDTLFMLSLVLCSTTLTYAARPGPKSNIDETTSQHEAARNSLEALIESCHLHGLSEDECLERRTLAAHLDYIYTQQDKP